MGPFTQEDPIGIAGGLNLYGYANGDPINFSDPFGLCPCILDAAAVGLGINDIRENGLGFGNGLGLAADVLALAIPGAPAVFGTAARAARARRLGAAGEAAVRGALQIGDKARIGINGRNRIPDGLTADVLTEVKNVNSLSFTRQLRDFADYAQDTGRQFDLFVRPDTRLSGPLQEAMEAGRVNLRLIPNN